MWWVSYFPYFSPELVIALPVSAGVSTSSKCCVSNSSVLKNVEGAGEIYPWFEDVVVEYKKSKCKSTGAGAVKICTFMT